MTHKTAYIWGSSSSFSGQLVSVLLHKGWQVHIAVKSALNVFSFSPLDLASSAQTTLEHVLDGHNKFQIFQDRLRFVNQGEKVHGTKYDAVIFCGLPPNFDESRVARAPWAAKELADVAKVFKEAPIFVVSSLWGGIQTDGAVPEELEFERRKAQSNFEGICQQYEHNLLKSTANIESPWHLIRLPLITGSTVDGKLVNFSGLSTLLQALSTAITYGQKKALSIYYNPDSTLWFLPVNTACHLFWRLLEDSECPRICNLVATESILNLEWMQYLASSLGYPQVEAVNVDQFSIPSILRKMLLDSIQIKTRNLFTVTGRYQYTPDRLDEAYFKKLLAFGQAKNWGLKKSALEKTSADASEEISTV